MIFLKLFISFFQIGIFSFGGGYAALRLIQNQVVDINHWLTISEFTDTVTISQMTPGPIAINAATFVGIKIAGIPGALVATFGCIFPSCVIVLILAHFYYKYRQLNMVQGILKTVRPAVVAMIGAAGLSILMISLFANQNIIPNFQNIDLIAVVLFSLSLFILRKWKPNPILIMIETGILGMILYQIF